MDVIGTANPSAPSSSSNEISVQEETLMKYFSGLIQASFGSVQSAKRTNGQIKVHWRVSSTAIIYFRKFYSLNNLLHHDPRIIMLSAVFLAGKIEDCRVGIRDLLEVYDKCTAENIKSCELLLIEALDYEFSVKHPQSYVHTLIADFKRVSSEVSSNRNSFSNNESSDSAGGRGAMETEEEVSDRESTARREWALAAEAALYTLQLTSASQLYSPLEIAVCAMNATEPSGALSLTLQDFLFRRFGNTAQSLVKNLAAITAILDTAKGPIDLLFLKTVCMERLKKDSVWSKAKVKKPKLELPTS